MVDLPPTRFELSVAQIKRESCLPPSTRMLTGLVVRAIGCWKDYLALLDFCQISTHFSYRKKKKKEEEFPL